MFTARRSRNQNKIGVAPLSKMLVSRQTSETRSAIWAHIRPISRTEILWLWSRFRGFSLARDGKRFACLEGQTFAPEGDIWLLEGLRQSRLPKIVRRTTSLFSIAYTDKSEKLKLAAHQSQPIDISFSLVFNNLQKSPGATHFPACYFLNNSCGTGCKRQI